ncbi:MAG: hypothetical protein KKB37_10790, partial [Alphaproteobacteria bacterium]|nr:hypothetical protein [Alphaproteobacteria bacterium]
MAHAFQETAPGVFTATVSADRNGPHHNVVVLDSAGTWQLFIDGEPAARDLPSFEAAAREVDLRIRKPGSTKMVKAAVFLVVASLAGATAVGASKFVKPLLADLSESTTATPRGSRRPAAPVTVKLHEIAARPSAPLIIRSETGTATPLPEAPSIEAPTVEREASAIPPQPPAP